MEVDASSNTVAKGNSVALTAKAIYDNNSTSDILESIEFISSNTNRLAPDTNGSNHGLFHAMSVGSAIISVQYKNYEVNTTITITDAELVSLSTMPTAVSLAKGQNTTLQALGTFTDGSSTPVTNGIQWESSDESVASFDSTGVLQTHQVGVADIYASQGNIESNVQTINVGEAVLESLELNTSKSLIYVSDTVQLNVNAKMSDSSNGTLAEMITWSSSDNSIATIDSNGLLSALSSGTIIVTATSGSISGNLSVSIDAAYLVSISVDEPSSIEEGQSGSLSAVGTYNDGTTKDISNQVVWSVENESIASINGSSFVGLVPGTTNITAELAGIEESAPITVTVQDWRNHVNVYSSTSSGVNINGYWQAGSSFGFTINNGSKYSIRLSSIQITMGGSSLSQPSSTLGSGQSKSYGITLNQPISGSARFSCTASANGISKNYSASN